MNLQSKSTESTRSSEGSALPVVLFFAAIGMITIFTFILNQLSAAKPSLRSPSSVQALMTARSGIYKAFESFRTKDTSLFADTLKTISTLDSLFGKELVEYRDSSDELNSTPREIRVFTADSFGTCEVALIPQGSFFILESWSTYNTIKRHVSAKLGGKIPALPDTVLIYYNDSPWEGNKPDGKVVALKTVPPDTSNSLISKMVDNYRSQLQLDDSIMFNQPLVIQSSSDLIKIKDTILGHLFLDGSHFPFTWNADRKIMVLGDIQISGEVTIKKIDFIAGGEIKILDKSDVSGSLYSQSRIFIGDQARYSGEAIAEHSITIYDRARVTAKSSLLVSGTAFSSKDSLKYSIIIADESSVDASCLALKSPGGIKTDENTIVTGLLWAQNTVCHRGKMKGLIRAVRVIDCDDPGQLSSLSAKDTAASHIINKNALPGKLSPLETITDYPIPYLGGIPELIEWKED